MPINNRVLDNGIRLISEPIASTKAAAIGFWFSCGSRDERDGEYGVTHFIEHMVFKGTVRHSTFEIARYFDRIGGYVNAFTEREHVCIHCLVPSYAAAEATALIADMVFNSAMADEDIERERDVIETEVLAALEDPDEMGMDAAVASIFPGHPVSRPIGGTAKNIQSLKRDTIRGAYRRMLAAGQLLVTCAGNFDQDELERALGSIEMPDFRREPDSAASPRWHPFHGCIRSRFMQSQIFYSLEISDFHSPSDWYVWSVINAIIGDSVSSRLFQNLREKRGLCYSVFSFFSFNRDFASWTAYLSVSPDKTEEAVALLLEEMRKISSSGLDEAEIGYAKEHLTGEMILASDDIDNRMKRLARQFYHSGEICTIEESIDMIRAIGTDDVNAAVRTVFAGTNRSCLVYGKRKIKKELVCR